MGERIPQSTSYLVVFRAFLASDGKTPATGKTIAITISKNGATSFSNPNAGATNATEMASGFYKFTLDTTDTGTLGPLAWRGAEGTINDAGDVLTVAKATNGGFSALPDAAAEASGGLYTRGTGAGQIAQDANGTARVTVTDVDTGAITATSFAAGAIDAAALATDAVNEIADGILNRDMSTGTDSGSTTVRTVRQALRFLRNKWSISGTTLTVTKEDDVTASWTATMTTDAAADPITASDPAGP